MIIGAIGSGKTTLIQAIKKLDIKHRKTQVLEYYDNIIDTPGEYLENRRFYNALITTSFNCDLILLIQDSTSKRCIFPPNFASIFNKPVIGIVSKIDIAFKDIDYSINCLKLAGVDKIFQVSSLKGMGLENIKGYIE